jgi:hypothetical protein
MLAPEKRLHDRPSLLFSSIHARKQLSIGPQYPSTARHISAPPPPGNLARLLSAPSLTLPQAPAAKAVGLLLRRSRSAVLPLCHSSAMDWIGANHLLSLLKLPRSPLLGERWLRAGTRDLILRSAEALLCEFVIDVTSFEGERRTG